MSDPSFSLADELLALRSDDIYIIPNEVAVDDLSPSQQSATLDSTIDLLTASTDDIVSSDAFDTLRSFLKHFAALSPSIALKLVDLISSSFSASLDAAARDFDSADPSAYASHAPVIERYAFLMQWFVSAAEKKGNTPQGDAIAVRGRAKGRGRKGGAAAGASKDTFQWEDYIPNILGTMLKALRVRSERMWTVTASRDAYISGCILRPALYLQENEQNLKAPEIRIGTNKVICQAVKAHGQAFSVHTSIMQSLQYYEHLSEPMAELLHLLRTDFDYERLGEDVLRDVASKSFGALDSKSPRSFGRFLVRMAQLSPRSVLKVVSLLQAHLNSESYVMRNALIEILGILIQELSTSDDVEMNASNGEEEQGPRPEEARKKQVETFFQLLFQRFLDLNSYVRSKLLTVLSKLCELPTKFPRQRQRMTDLVIRAFEDKSSTVRKNAIGLLTKLILTHPYGVMHGGELCLTEWSERYGVLKAQLSELEKGLEMPAGEESDSEEEEELYDSAEEQEQINVVSDDEDEIGNTTEDADRSKRKRIRSEKAKGNAAKQKEEEERKKKPRKTLDLAALQAAQESMSQADADKLLKMRLTKQYYSDAIHFIRQIEGAMPVLEQLLVSTNKAEVLESMEFFRIAHEYRLEGSQEGIRKMVHLIWTKDNTLIGDDGKELKGIRSRLIEVFRSLYFEPLPNVSAKDNVARIARNMIERTFGATLAELTSLEQLFSTMASQDMIDDEVVRKLWAVYATGQKIPQAQRRGAIIVLSMVAIANKDIVAERLDTLLKTGLGPLGARDIVLARHTCVALSRISGSVKKVKGALSDDSVRYPMSHPLFARLRGAIEMQPALGSSNASEWFSLAEHAVQAIYLLGQQPDALCGDIIKTLTMRALGAQSSKSAPPAAPAPVARESQPLSPRENLVDAPQSELNAAAPLQTGPKGSAFQLAQLLFVVGHVALKQIVYLEVVEREVKRRKAEVDAEKKQAAENADTSKQGDQGGEELDQVAGNAEDDIGETISGIREKELLSSMQSLLALFGPMVSHICSNPKMYSNVTLRKAAVLTLCKFMCVSSAYCEANLGLMFHILGTSSDPVTRSNVVIALGDIAISFGTLVDENSDRLYAGLKDRDLGVKKHTLMVLTHLILNGMIKVKGQLGEMAKCLEDKERRVSDLAKLFFSELSTKENAVYNNLPDIISHLSIGQHAVDEKTFEQTMTYIFGFIDKEKQAENVVEKLCQRFRLTSEERQWRDIAFCLSLLPYKSERSIKKLIEGLPFYQDKLHSEAVFLHFSEILTKARSNRSSATGAKAATSGGASESDLHEFEQILESFKAKGEEDKAFESKAHRITKAAAGKKKAAAAAKGKKAPPARAAASRPTRGRAATRRTVEDDDEDDDD
ncbi:condensin complex non-SMC subunit Cnd1 [Tilletia horrida]|uniref:Condensin complex subunit 1 n=1 Tax=Tilletia horrida TaxID=155126 RepID=A0AAN6GQ51_9BASI|nr:condensin complex non-SMC subunit Cnd1 [Tilletia horrida]KAK0551983.1 condensin complex non-SMC subunit Cnd1 [Tilletia horrida]KAK0566172.1 condensin complex non-SMC subunit Cnd1 [Tilletia horrida]